VGSSAISRTCGVGMSVITKVGVGGTGWNGVTVTVASGGAQTIIVPGGWFVFDPPSINTQAINKNPSARSAMAKIGLRHLDGDFCCLPVWGVGCIDLDDIPEFRFLWNWPGFI